MFFKIETEIVKYDSIENAIRTTALIVRNEPAITLPTGVEISYKASEGERVSSGKKILEVIKNNQTDVNIAIKIKQLNDRINEIKQSDINNNFFSKDKEKIERQINERVGDLKNIAKSGDFKRFDTIKDDLVADLYKKSLIYGEGSFFGKNLEQLQKEKSTLEGIYNNSIDVIYAQTSGVVSHSLDGYEQILSPMNIKDFSLNSIKEIIGTVKSINSSNNKEPINGIKIVDNFLWYTCSLISEDQAKELIIGKKVRLRFNDFENAEVNGEIYEVSASEGDTCLVIIKITEYASKFYSKRIAEMDIIKDYNEGFIVPLKAIVVKDNIKGVYVLRRGMIKFVPVAVMTEDKDRCLVKNLDEESSGLKTGYDPLKVFDEVIITTEKVKENQVLTDKI